MLRLKCYPTLSFKVFAHSFESFRSVIIQRYIQNVLLWLVHSVLGQRDNIISIVSQKVAKYFYFDSFQCPSYRNWINKIIDFQKKFEFVEVLKIVFDSSVLNSLNFLDSFGEHKTGKSLNQPIFRKILQTTAKYYFFSKSEWKWTEKLLWLIENKFYFMFIFISKCKRKFYLTCFNFYKTVNNGLTEIR